MDTTGQRFNWRKSSYSGSGDNCVEVAVLQDGGHAVRDSKNPSGPVLFFPAADWTAFIDRVKNGVSG